jgi:hypothetical protein
VQGEGASDPQLMDAAALVGHLVPAQYVRVPGRASPGGAPAAMFEDLFPMGLVSVLAFVNGFMHVPGLGIDHRDHPVRRDARCASVRRCRRSPGPPPRPARRSTPATPACCGRTRHGIVHRQARQGLRRGTTEKPKSDLNCSQTRVVTTRGKCWATAHTAPPRCATNLPSTVIPPSSSRCLLGRRSRAGSPSTTSPSTHGQRAGACGSRTRNGWPGRSSP